MKTIADIPCQTFKGMARQGGLIFCNMEKNVVEVGGKDFMTMEGLNVALSLGAHLSPGQQKQNWNQFSDMFSQTPQGGTPGIHGHGHYGK